MVGRICAGGFAGRRKKRSLCRVGGKRGGGGVGGTGGGVGSTDGGEATPVGVDGRAISKRFVSGDVHAGLAKKLSWRKGGAVADSRGSGCSTDGGADSASRGEGGPPGASGQSRGVANGESKSTVAGFAQKVGDAVGAKICGGGGFYRTGVEWGKKGYWPCG